MKVLWIASISACLHFMQPLAQVQRCRERASAHWLSILWWVQPQPFHTGSCLICESCSFCFICTVCKILIRRGRGVNTEVNPSSVFALETVLHFDLSMSCWPRITTCIVSSMTPIHTKTYKRVYTVICYHYIFLNWPFSWLMYVQAALGFHWGEMIGEQYI